jgi:hypothetical protein
MSENPQVDYLARVLVTNFREELTKTVRLMVGAMNAFFDQLEAEQRDERSQDTKP